MYEYELDLYEYELDLYAYECELNEWAKKLVDCYKRLLKSECARSTRVDGLATYRDFGRACQEALSEPVVMSLRSKGQPAVPGAED